MRRANSGYFLIGKANREISPRTEKRKDFSLDHFLFEFRSRTFGVEFSSTNFVFLFMWETKRHSLYGSLQAEWIEEKCDEGRREKTRGKPKERKKIKDLFFCDTLFFVFKHIESISLARNRMKRTSWVRHYSMTSVWTLCWIASVVSLKSKENFFVRLEFRRKLFVISKQVNALNLF